MTSIFPCQLASYYDLSHWIIALHVFLVRTAPGVHPESSILKICVCVCAHAAHCKYAGRQKGHRSGLDLPGASYELCGGVLNQIKDFLKRSVFNY